MVITGYKINTTDLREVTKSLDKIKTGIRLKINKRYNDLLGEEIAFICDNVALGVINRNPDVTIFDEALKNLEYKIRNAKLTNAENKYNFTLYAHIMPYEDATYLKINCPNKEYIEAFSVLEDYSLDEIECQDKFNNKTVIWNKIHDIYSKSSVPLVVDFYIQPEADKSSITYPSKKDRAETRARHTLTSHYLNIVSGGQQIPPILLMPYMDMALDMFELPDAKAEYRNKVTNLMQILTDLNKDDSFIYKRAGDNDIEVQDIG